MILKTDEEVELLRESCLLVSKTLAHVATIIKPGITGIELDKQAETLIRDHGAVPAFLGHGGFPGTLCISINDAVVHGVPANNPIKETDIVSVDCGVLLNGFYGDSAFSIPMVNISEESQRLCIVTRESLYIGIEKAVAGNRVGDISYAIQTFTEKEHNYTVVRELVGHGIGRNLHEPPEVPNFGKRGRGVLLKSGLCIAIEPMINIGTRKVKQSKDGYTILTRDSKMSAHYEHTVCVRPDKVDILSDHREVEKAIKNNEYTLDLF